MNKRGERETRQLANPTLTTNRRLPDKPSDSLVSASALRRRPQQFCDEDLPVPLTLFIAHLSENPSTSPAPALPSRWPRRTPRYRPLCGTWTRNWRYGKIRDAATSRYGDFQGHMANPLSLCLYRRAISRRKGKRPLTGWIQAPRPVFERWGDDCLYHSAVWKHGIPIMYPTCGLGRVLT